MSDDDDGGDSDDDGVTEGSWPAMFLPQIPDLSDDFLFLR